jgi:hypothetical protein
MKWPRETPCPATHARAESPAGASIERGYLEGPAGASEIGLRGHSRPNTPGKRTRKLRSVDFDETNQAGLAPLARFIAEMDGDRLLQPRILAWWRA